MTHAKVRFEKRKVEQANIIEVYRYNTKDSKDEFFRHYKTMQSRGFKNDRSQDVHVEGDLVATYVKNVLAVKPLRKKKGRA